MRIISGSNRGRKLVQIKGHHIRPTSDRTREAIFNIIGPKIIGSSVLDVFAGTGALGLEALSRGAKHSVFIDNSTESCKTIKDNIRICRQEENASLYFHDIIKKRSPSFLKKNQFDYIFMDPPYYQGFIERLLKDINFLNLASDNATIIAEHSIKEDPFKKIVSLDIYKQRKYSKTLVSFLTKIQQGTANE